MIVHYHIHIHQHNNNLKSIYTFKLTGKYKCRATNLNWQIKNCRCRNIQKSFGNKAIR